MFAAGDRGIQAAPCAGNEKGHDHRRSNNGLSFMMRNAVCEQARVISAGGEIQATFIGDVEEM
jgi:hypothetical protein